MRFEPVKDAINRQKHKVSLGLGDQIFADQNYVILPSIRKEDGEERFKVIGLVDNSLYTGVFVWRKGLPRYISVRRSNKDEERSYRATG